MQTKRDLLQAHRLMTHRASQALIFGEPDNPEQPLRRLNVGTFAGVMVGVLVAAGFGIAGLLLGGGTKGITDGGVLLIEKETGSRYVWCKSAGTKDGKALCPVANYASARLAVAGSSGDVNQKSVSAKTLSKFPRGPMIGIPGAPDTVPDKKRLVGGPWSVCVRQVDQGGVTKPVVSLVGGRNVGGRTLDASTGVVVSAGATGNWLIWNNQRMKMSPAGMTVLQASAATPVSSAFVNALPAGPDFAAPAIPGFGRPANLGGGLRGTIGQVYAVSSGAGGGAQPYVLLADGVAPISRVQAALIQSSAAYRMKHDMPLEAALVTSNRSAQKLIDGRLPQDAIKAATFNATDSLCVVYPDASKGGDRAKLTIGGATDLPAPTGRSTTGTGVDNVVLPPGSAVLAGVLPAGGSVSAINSYSFVSDDGRRYPLKSPDTAKALGYSISADQNDSVPVPANLLNMVPQGPVLDPQKALLPVSGTTTG
ncbi:type VII secretion protein EccB [Actinomadura rayongensis]|uniref:Type VII secretion protein EccB n=1 Tax=Actinomadura rayongensis TaxID=1429076 RepID=A0A6I4WDF8_9ACTN|nr:type VII secretion protein EccB [Actinomadura rayongensis]MXQ64792.1 type VII secretion protein EccB [Actinomadura rayongensis]